MSDGAISQSEIDALLSGVGGIEEVSAPESPSGSGLAGHKKDALSKFAKDNIPGLSSNLESMTSKSVTVSDPVIELLEKETFLNKLPETVISSQINFTGTFSGEHSFVMDSEFAKKVVGLVNNEENVEIDDMALSVISETIGQYVGTQLTALEGAGMQGVSSEPAESLSVPKAALKVPANNFVSLCYSIQLEGGSYKIWEVMSEPVVDSIVKAIAGEQPAGGDMGGGVSQSEMNAMIGGMQQMNATPQQNGMGAMNPMMGGGMPQGGGMNMMGDMSGMAGMGGMNPNIQSVQFPQLQGFSAPEEQGNIGLIMDVYMEMTVELGRTKKMIKEILGMGEGHIIELDKLAGEPVDILVNHKPIAKGEVVVIEENFGVRITEILSPAERLTDV